MQIRRFFLIPIFAIVAVALSACSAPITSENIDQPAGTAATGTSEQSQDSPPKQTEPTVETKSVSEESEIAYEKKTVDDSGLDKGKTVVRTKGVNGKKVLTYEVTLTNGEQTNKKLIKEETVAEPVAEITAVGTKVAPAPKPAPVVETNPAPKCDPNYSGACVPIASDVDCAGGSGNGPAYVRGPVQVIGSDIYDLDRDGDGSGCEN